MSACGDVLVGSSSRHLVEHCIACKEMVVEGEWEGKRDMCENGQWDAVVKHG